MENVCIRRASGQGARIMAPFRRFTGSPLETHSQERECATRTVLRFDTNRVAVSPPSLECFMHRLGAIMETRRSEAGTLQSRRRRRALTTPTTVLAAEYDLLLYGHTAAGEYECLLALAGQVRRAS